MYIFQLTPGQSVLINADSRRLDLLGIDRIYGTKIVTKTGDVAKGRNAKWRVHF